MADIDVGLGAINYGSALSGGLTAVQNVNPANDTGVIDTVELWVQNDVTGLIVATFSASGSVLAATDSVSIGSVSPGAKRTFTGLSLDVNSGDYIGLFCDTGNPSSGTSSGNSVWYSFGDKTETSGESFNSFSDTGLSLYGTGSTVTVGGGNMFMMF